MAHQSRFTRLSRVEAVNTDGQLLKDILLSIASFPPHGLLWVRSVAVPRSSKVSSVIVACNHSEARLERLDVLAVQEVVSAWEVSARGFMTA